MWKPSIRYGFYLGRNPSLVCYDTAATQVATPHQRGEMIMTQTVLPFKRGTTDEPLTDDPLDLDATQMVTEKRDAK